MDKILKLGLLRLLSGSPQEVTTEEIQNAYGGFMEHIAMLTQSTTDLPDTFRKLNLARIELDSLGTSFLYGKGEKRAQKNIPAQSDIIP